MSARRDALHSVQEVRFACQLSPLVALVANVRPGHVSCMVQAGLRASRVLFSPGMLACGAPFSPRCTLPAIPLLSQPQPGNVFPSSSPCSSDDSGRTGAETGLEGLEGMTVQTLVTCTFRMGPALSGAGLHDTLRMAHRCRD